MTSQEGSPITEVDIENYLSNQDDFALELRVLLKTRQLGCRSMHGGTYIDPVTNKPRQYDLRVYGQHLGGDWRAAFAIECKALQPSYPLVLLRVPRTKPESLHHLLMVSPHGVFEADKASSKLHPFDGHVGKSAFQMGRNKDGTFKKGRDGDVYDKWTQALSSAEGLVKEFVHPSKGSFSAIVLPILVVSDGCLWAVDYSEDGQMLRPPTQVDQATLFVDREYAIGVKDFHIKHLQIFTEQGISELLRLMNVGSWWDAAFS